MTTRCSANIFHKLFEDEDSEVQVQLNQLAENVGVYLKKQFPGDVEVRFTVNPPQFGDLLKSFDTTVNDGVVTKAQDKGDGMQRAIMLSIIQAFADFRKKQSVGSSFLFLIDEAELHLHPSAQRLLKQALIDISKTDQVMLKNLIPQYSLSMNMRIRNSSKSRRWIVRRR